MLWMYKDRPDRRSFTPLDFQWETDEGVAPGRRRLQIDAFKDGDTAAEEAMMGRGGIVSVPVDGDVIETHQGDLFFDACGRRFHGYIDEVFREHPASTAAGKGIVGLEEDGFSWIDVDFI